MTTRRGFLAAILAAILAASMAPTIVKADSLMKIVKPRFRVDFRPYGDGVTDDTLALNALFAGKLVETASGILLRNKGYGHIFLPTGNYVISDTLIVPQNDLTARGSMFLGRNMKGAPAISVNADVTRATLENLIFTTIAQQ